MIVKINPPPAQDLPLLARLGAQITARRKVLKVRAQVCAEVAGISRVTLHRIEKGEPTVSIGAYLQVCEALGLHLALLPIAGQKAGANLQGPEVPHIRIKDYPQLKALCWQLKDDGYLTDAEALSIYERNKRFLDLDHIEDRERKLMQRLIDTRGMEQLF
ncbi:helix-turn-helix domain-containing protein [Polynucleobacter sp. AP-Sanab-80-C2]|jgi:transcriptional regulator with XRE-family HTH domain|uniref:helix-turn-helix domain-containing protein n=1 Tax=Polynucleobacter sp. AP-Sanab-80-C2 TaxID=3108274 RepID=UPI002B225CB7|nr:helix-turn-helix domain-containing protein [Polynucleobacter sp. AP-Sanab-80-C2]MEA9598509.1 helix-turn-helix domain-containing protein [Polynucleobacter sp. AP-Sanab-80-C2]